MSGESFRFIHASDFHLETPLGELDAIPPSLSDAMASAPRRAAAAVFEAALADNIDFLILAGDLLSPIAAGPHGMSLLIEGFEKLNAKKKPVFWTAGSVDDPAKWPESVPLPPNVKLFSKTSAELIPVIRSGRTIAAVVGRSSDGRNLLHVPSYRVDPSEEFLIGVGYGKTDAAALSESRFDYWALGGLHNRTEIEGGAPAGAVYSGSPQGRQFDETGPHGYTVVDVDSDRTTRIHFVESDSFRYVNDRIDANQAVAVGSLKNYIGERIGRLQHDGGGRHLLVNWDVNVSDGEQLGSVGDAQSLLRSLRRDFGHGTPATWSTSIKIRSPKSYPKAWHDEDTILGDFLRAAETHRAADGGKLNLLPLTEEHSLPSTTQTLLADVPASKRNELLEAATLLGVDLLRGGKLPLG
jgi:DNA repair protein SbcD/Mre11